MNPVNLRYGLFSLTKTPARSLSGTPAWNFARVQRDYPVVNAMVGRAYSLESTKAGYWLFLAMALLSLYCIFSPRWRDVILSECYKPLGMKRTGTPASVRTAVLAFTGWAGAFLTCYFPHYWEWDYSGVLFIGLFVIVLLSSYLDSVSFRRRTWR